MQKRRSTFIALLVMCIWVLSACGPMTIRDTEANRFVPIQGWVLKLRQDVIIPPNRTRIFFQNGRILYAINEYEPHCQLRVRPISQQAQPVHADRFTIYKVFGDADSIVSNGPIRLAAAGAAVALGEGGDGDSPFQVIYFYFMGLQSDRQPDVSYLVCGGALDNVAPTRYPTLQEIRTALGDYATLVTPGD